MRVVLDTNTLISALVFYRERWNWLREAWKSGSVVPLLCKETAKELIRVLAYPKFRLSEVEQKALLQDIVPYCETVTELGTDDLELCRDQNDQIFLRLAHRGEASLLVSGDDDLLSYKGLVAFRIVTPAHLKALLEAG
jgi:putative PIN family toxin of toxin-antitoxin system